MRAVWRQSTRPKLSSRTTTRESILNRGATTNPLRHRPGFNDFFTVFLAPVLAAATIANLSWKDKQRKDWDKRFAEIDHELELLRAREQEIWSRVQMQSIRKGAACQRRSYSTAVAPSAMEPEHAETEAADRKLEQYSELNPLPMEDDEVSVEHEREQVPEDINELPPAPPEDPALRRFERLIAFRLALQMLLQVHVGGNPKFGDIYQPDYFETHQLPRDINTIVTRLKQVGSELASLQSLSPERLRPRPDHRRRSSPENRRLGNQLRYLGEQYKTGGIKLEGLVERFAQIIMDNPAAPDIGIYTSLIHLFNYVEQEDLSYLVVAALKDSSLYLDKRAVHTLLWRYGKSKDLLRFDAFLRELTRTDGRVQDPWEWRRVHGNLIPVPSSFSSLICTRLIAIALACDQPDRAEAWASIMDEERPFHVRQLLVMKHFMQHYAMSSNWDKGKAWLAKVIEFGRQWGRVSWNNSLGNAHQEMQLTILRMLDLCAACGREQVYVDILQAAVDVSIQPPVLSSARPQFAVPSHVRIIRDWTDALEDPDRSQTMHVTANRIEAFSEKLAPLADELIQKKVTTTGPTTTSGFGFVSNDGLASTIEASQQDEVIRQQQLLIQKLQDEIALSSRTNEEERRRLVQLRQHDNETATLHQQQITALRQELQKLKPQIKENADDDRSRMEMVLLQQAASMEAMQKQISQLAELVSNPPRPSSPPVVDEPERDIDSGYGSDSASDKDSDQQSSFGSRYIRRHIAESRAPVEEERSWADQPDEKPFYSHRLTLQDDQQPSKTPKKAKQAQKPRPKLSRAPLKSILRQARSTATLSESSRKTPADSSSPAPLPKPLPTTSDSPVMPEPPLQDVKSQTTLPEASPTTPELPTEPPAPLPTSAAPISRRLLLTSVVDWLQFNKSVNASTLPLRHLSLSSLAVLDDSALADMGVKFDWRREHMLADIAYVMSMSPDQRDAATKEAKQIEHERIMERRRKKAEGRYQKAAGEGWIDLTSAAQRQKTSIGHDQHESRQDETVVQVTQQAEQRPVKVENIPQPVQELQQLQQLQQQQAQQTPHAASDEELKPSPKEDPTIEEPTQPRRSHVSPAEESPREVSEEELMQSWKDTATTVKRKGWIVGRSDDLKAAATTQKRSD